MEKGSILPRSKAQVQDKLLKFKATGLTVEQAREAMLAEAQPVELSRENRVQGKVPQFIQIARERQGFNQHNGPSGATTQIIPEPAERGTGGSAAAVVANDAHERVDAAERKPAEPVESVAVESPTPVQAIPERQAQPAQDAPDSQRRKLEDEYRKIEFYHDGREWVANITYKDGRQPERFKARSKDDLIIKMADGKAHATRKIATLTRRIAVGSTYDNWDFYFKRVEKDFGYTAQEFTALPEKTQKMIQQTLLNEDEQTFVNAYPDYYGTKENYEAFLAYLNKHQIPWTFHNIQIAYEDLLAQGVLDIRPDEEIVVEEEQETVASNATPTPALLSAASTPVAVVTAPVVHSTVEPVADNPAPAPATPPRKRGSTGLIPGNSSAVPSAPAVDSEAGKESREVSTKELKTMDIKELRRAAIPSLNRPSVRR